MANRGGYYDEEQMSSRGKLPFSQSSSSSSSYHSKPIPPLGLSYQQQSWLESKHDSLGFNNTIYDNIQTSNNDADSTNDAAVIAGGSGGGGVVVVEEKEHMFDKVVTPSDVGKLNRLVIPKQHAEKYFPLDSSTNEKGLLLNFEDRTGKPWRFRYSYWNSSQSYVMTKGWSRFVKEKKLDAGDIVSFQRGVGESGKDRLYIDWRRRPDAPELPRSFPSMSFPHQFSFYNPLSLQPRTVQTPSWDYPRFQSPYHNQAMCGRYGYGDGNSYGYSGVVNPNTGSVIYLRPSPQQAGMVMGGGGGGGGGVEVEPVVFDSVPVVHGKAAAKRLRLFGVNMDCPISDSDDCEILPSASTTTTTTTTTTPQYQQPYLAAHQLRLYNGSPVPATTTMPAAELFNKGKSSMSLDLDI